MTSWAAVLTPRGVVELLQLPLSVATCCLFRPLKRTNTSSCFKGDYSYNSEDTIDLTSTWGRFETHSNSTLPNLTCSASENNGNTTNIEAWKIIALTSNVPFPDKCSAGCVQSISKDWQEDKHVRILPWTANCLPLPVKMDGRMERCFLYFF